MTTITRSARMIRPRTIARPALAAGAAAALAFSLASPAQAATISAGHWDVVAEVDCATNTIDLHAHEHDGTTEQPLTTATTFTVTGTTGNSVASTANDRAKFGGVNPARVLTQNETLAPPKLVVGFEAEYVNCGTSRPTVTFVRSGATTVPTGQRAASYLNASGNPTQIDTTTASNRNTGVVTNDHEDRRWGFTGTGTYNIGLKATASVNGSVRSDTGTIRFAVS